MSRIPIRLRLALAFALAMAVVLAATGAFLYLRLQSSLDEGIDEGLEVLSAQATADVRRGEPVGATPVPADERFIQVLALDGRLLDATPRDFAGPARTLARSTESPDGRVVVVVGAALEDRDETLGGFLTELLLIGPAALLVASLLGYGLAAAALRPVESMRAEAAAISGAEPGRRLPLPQSRDEVRRLGETLNAMLGRLQRALERERGFVADASHELRTPLALLKAELELALRHPRSADELRMALRSAAEETDRLVGLAEDLLVLARSDQGRLSVRREPVQVSQLLDHVARRFGEPVSFLSAPDGLTVVGDSSRLEQALASLVDNALRHGGGAATLSAIPENGVVELHVRDEGPGFPAEFLPRAFERFSRPDEARSGHGAGLGLALAQAIAVAHGGSAGAANRARGGADVWLAIPATPDDHGQ
jgi:two-component system, OmpR family, sensor kinase